MLHCGARSHKREITNRSTEIGVVWVGKAIWIRKENLHTRKKKKIRRKKPSDTRCWWSCDLNLRNGKVIRLLSCCVVVWKSSAYRDVICSVISTKGRKLVTLKCPWNFVLQWIHMFSKQSIWTNRLNLASSEITKTFLKKTPTGITSRNNQQLERLRLLTKKTGKIRNQTADEHPGYVSLPGQAL